MAAQPDSWKREPFGDTRSIPYASHFSDAEFDCIKAGLIPSAMEDKWFIYFSEPSLFVHRSWTGKAVYQIDFEREAEGAHVKSAVCATDVLSTSNEDYQATLLNFLIGNLLLGRSEPFPMPSGVEKLVPGVFQHAISGTGYPEVPVQVRPPWWKFWR